MAQMSGTGVARGRPEIVGCEMVQMLGVGVAHLPTGTYNRYPGMGDGCRHPIDLHAGLLHITTIFGRYSVLCPLVFGSGGPDWVSVFTTDQCRGSRASRLFPIARLHGQWEL